MALDRMFSAASGVIEAPDLWEKRLPAAMAAQAPQLVQTDGGLAWQVGDRRTAPLALDASVPGATGPLGRSDIAWLATADGRRWVQERDQVSGEVLYAVGEVWDLIDASEDDAFKAACARAYNDWLAELCAADPARFVGAAKIPTSGIDDAVAELTRAVGTLGLKAAMLDAWPAGADTPPAVRECEVFWEAAAALRVPLGLHRPLNGDREPAVGIGGGTAPEFYQDMTTIIYANIPDRHPDIRFVAISAGSGWAPPAFEALNESYMRTGSLRKVNLADESLLPSDYLRRFFTFTMQDDRTALLNRSYFGDAHLMWASMAFMGFDSVWPNTRQLFERLTAGLPEEARGLLASGVAHRLYGLGGAKPFSRAEVEDYVSYALI